MAERSPYYKPRAERARNRAITDRSLRFKARSDVECDGCGEPIFSGDPCYAHRNRDFHAPSSVATWRDRVAKRVRADRKAGRRQPWQLARTCASSPEVR